MPFHPQKCPHVNLFFSGNAGLFFITFVWKVMKVNKKYPVNPACPVAPGDGTGVNPVHYSKFDTNSLLAFFSRSDDYF